MSYKKTFTQQLLTHWLLCVRPYGKPQRCCCEQEAKSLQARRLQSAGERQTAESIIIITWDSVHGRGKENPVKTRKTKDLRKDYAENFHADSATQSVTTLSSPKTTDKRMPIHLNVYRLPRANSPSPRSMIPSAPQFSSDPAVVSKEDHMPLLLSPAPPGGKLE